MLPTPDGFPKVPVNRHLGFRLVSRDADTCEVEMEPRPELIQEAGVVHGGILAALADTASVYILFPHMSPGKTVTSIEFKMNFLKPVRPDAGPVRARAQIVQQGRKVAVTEVDVIQDGRRAAKGIFTYLLFPDPGAESGSGR